MNRLCKIVLFMLIALTASLCACGAGADDLIGANFTLKIFGNADMDETIDENDVAYVEGVIKGTNTSTNLSDANYDGKIDSKDIDQIEKIISGEDQQLTIIDCHDRIVTISKPVEHIISETVPIAAILRTLGVKDRVIGVDTTTASYPTFFPELNKLPCIGNPATPDYEKIIALKPDIVITGYDWPPKGEIEKKVEPAGITVVRMNCAPIPTYIEEVTKMGYIMGKKDRADEFINWYKSYMNIIANRVEKLSEEEKPKVFLYYGGELRRGEGPPYGTWGNDNYWGNPPVEVAGGTNIAKNLPGNWITVDAEWVLEQNPSIIIRSVFDSKIMSYEVDDPSGAKALRESSLSQPVLNLTDAVKNGDVYLLSTSLHFMALFVQIPYLAKWFHPELFEDLDPQAIHQEWLTRFQGLDYDLDKHGVFAYPESS